MRDKGIGAAVAIVIIVIIGLFVIGGYIALSKDISFPDVFPLLGGGGAGGGAGSDIPRSNTLR